MYDVYDNDEESFDQVDGASNGSIDTNPNRPFSVRASQLVSEYSGYGMAAVAVALGVVWSYIRT